MASTDTQRRLAAILSADVAGYSRLMGADEAATVETLASFRKVFLAHIEDQRGRVVDAKGDALLAEFASVVDAVNAAVEIQRELAERNAELPDTQRMDWRIGVNLGDVIARDDAIYGDGVNIAARLESLAEPGGVCISGSVYAQVRGKLALNFEFLGRKEVKNIAEPVPVYRVGIEAGAGEARTPGRRRWAVPAIAAVAVFFVLALGLAGYFGWRSFGPGVEQTALPLPDKPSIAVLPFDNLSGDKEQEYFSEGVSENIITQLSRLEKLSVISRTSSFSYRGKAVTAREIGQELGVRYVLEGSVQKKGKMVRITAQLIEAPSEKHVWAETYDRDLQDVFSLQDEIVRKIMAALEVHLTMDEGARVRFRSTDNLEAWEYYLKGMKLLRGATNAEIQASMPDFMHALELDPDFTAAMLGLGWACYEYQNFLGRQEIIFQQIGYKLLDKATELANQAIALHPSLAEPYALLGSVSQFRKDSEGSIRRFEQAVRLEPGVPEWKMRLAAALSWSGKHREAYQSMKEALPLEPFPADIFLEDWIRILYQTGRYEEAIQVAKRVLHRNPDRWKAQIFLMASYGVLGRQAEALAVFEKYSMGQVYQGSPKVRVQFRMPLLNPKDKQRLIEDLDKAGLPE